MIAGKEGAIEVIVKAMNTHTKDVDMCKYGCGALANITLNGK